MILHKSLSAPDGRRSFSVSFYGGQCRTCADARFEMTQPAPLRDQRPPRLPLRSLHTGAAAPSQPELPLRSVPAPYPTAIGRTRRQAANAAVSPPGQQKWYARHAGRECSMRHGMGLSVAEVYTQFCMYLVGMGGIFTLARPNDFLHCQQSIRSKIARHIKTMASCLERLK